MILDWGTPLNDSCPEEKDGGKEDHSRSQTETSFAGLGEASYFIFFKVTMNLNSARQTH